jgi:tripartite-type tricarboxylate transporter receptor subunit TctC
MGRAESLFSGSARAVGGLALLKTNQLSVLRTVPGTVAPVFGASVMKLPHRRRVLHLAAGAAALPAVSRTWAQAYPSRPVRIVVGYAAGGGTDIAARVIGQWLSERLGQQFIIENRPGAATNIATEAVARSAADGYTLLMATAANVINATYYDKLNFDFIRDIVPAAAIMRVPLVIVINPSLPIKSVPELIANAKANPRKITYASGGAGGPDHMAGEYFKQVTGTEILHVPYRGLSPALTDLISGQVQLIFATMPAAIEYIKAGRLRALAVTTASRSEALPDLPIVADVLPGFDASQWYALAAPRNTPADIIATINRTVLAGLSDPKMKTRIAELGGEPMPMALAEFSTFIADETEKWSKVVRFSGLRPE